MTPGEPVRGWVSLYALAFVLVLAAAVCVALAGRDFLQDLTLLKASVALSVCAIVVAVVSVVLPRRR